MRYDCVVAPQLEQIGGGADGAANFLFLDGLPCCVADAEQDLEQYTCALVLEVNSRVQ